MGAPNLTDDVWLFGGSAETIEEGLRKGRSSQMPAHKDILGEQKAHLVATYVYSLSHGTDAQGAGAEETSAPSAVRAASAPGAVAGVMPAIADETVRKD
jgi:cytochrome c oxidase cbb3-type subunit 3